MKTIIFTIVALFLPLSVLADDGFVPVDPASLNTLNETNHVIAAYSVLLGMMLVYVTVLVVRHLRTDKALKELSSK